MDSSVKIDFKRCNKHAVLLLEYHEKREYNFKTGCNIKDYNIIVL